MDIETYLKSEQARQDVQAALDRHRAGTDKTAARWTIASGVISDKSNPWLMAFCMSADSSDGAKIDDEPIIVYPTHEAVAIYFRQEGGLFFVNDLGGGWRAHRLHTGRVDWEEEIIAKCNHDPHIVSVQDGPLSTAGDCETVATDAADLPAAICRVMLASYKIGSLPNASRVTP